MEQHPLPAEQILAVGCTAHWSGTVAVDREGNPLGNSIIWMDTRGAPYVQEITSGPVRLAGFGVDKLLPWLRLTGGIPTPSGKDSIAHILFLKHERPEVYRAAYKFLEPKDYLNLRLTGRFATTFDAIILHWVTDNRDIHRICYDERLLRLTGVPREKFPDLYPTTHILGELQPQAARELGLPAGLPVVAGSPDLQAAALGSGVVRDYQAHVYVGTSSWVTCHLPFKKTDLFHNMASLPSAIPGRYFIANEQETAGACMTFLRDQLIYPHDALRTPPPPADAYRALDDLAATVSPGSQGVIFTPWLYGERTPVEDATIRGGFFNLSLNTSRAAMVRAVLEGVALNARWLLGYVEKFVRRKLERLHIIGGGAKSPVWCQIFADVLQRPIIQVKDPAMAGARGVAVLAAVALGHTTFEDFARHIPIAHQFHPNPDHRKTYEELFTVFVDIYRRTHSLYHRLNRRIVPHSQDIRSALK
jgi:xylulokinase